ncbi:unnamed protein product, partial [Amoebophrya sp. A120]|eukprot:GSA120T00025553001.1
MTEDDPNAFLSFLHDQQHNLFPQRGDVDRNTDEDGQDGHRHAGEQGAEDEEIDSDVEVHDDDDDFSDAGDHIDVQEEPEIPEEEVVHQGDDVLDEDVDMALQSEDEEEIGQLVMQEDSMELQSHDDLELHEPDPIAGFSEVDVFLQSARPVDAIGLMKQKRGRNGKNYNFQQQSQRSGVGGSSSAAPLKSAAPRGPVVGGNEEAGPYHLHDDE